MRIAIDGVDQTAPMIGKGTSMVGACLHPFGTNLNHLFNFFEFALGSIFLHGRDEAAVFGLNFLHPWSLELRVLIFPVSQSFGHRLDVLLDVGGLALADFDFGGGLDHLAFELLNSLIPVQDLSDLPQEDGDDVQIGFRGVVVFDDLGLPAVAMQPKIHLVFLPLDQATLASHFLRVGFNLFLLVLQSLLELLVH